MRAIADLGRELTSINANALNRFGPGAGAGMAKLAVDLARRRSQKMAGLALLSTVERQMQALRRFRTSPQVADLRTLRYVCLGCTLNVAEEQFALLANPSLLDALLAAVDGYAAQPRRFRRLYERLLRAYLSADRQAEWFADAAAKEGNERLRSFLAASFESIRGIEPVPAWLHTLAAYPEVLSSDPGRRFADALLAGSLNELYSACRGLDLDGGCWLAAETLRTARSVAVTSDDATFVTHIPTFLSVVGEPRFETLRNETYAALITRYAECRATPVHADLRDALVAAWGNPLLPRNEKRWPVGERERNVVAGWLKLHLIQQFFDVLSDDRSQDRSRFQFWSQYHERMDDVYIALGSAAYYSSRPDLVKLRKDLEGRLLKLEDTGSNTNAFIMFMGDDVVVEFSQYGNAAVCYRRSQAPVHGGGGNISIRQLRSAPPGVRMIHGQSRGLTWQERFAQTLCLGTKVQPTVDRRGPLPTNAGNVRTQYPARQDRSLPHLTPYASRQTSPKRAPSETEDIHAFLRKHNLNWRDNRPKGGNLTIFAGMDHSDIVRQLMHWGFAYSQKGHFWWKTT